MAIYHCTVKMIGRSSGRSSVAAAAYRAGEKITNQYDGVEHDFTRKHWIEYGEILLPPNAPEAYADRGTLWNAVELAEKSSNAQLAREFELALPVEMTREQQIEVLHRFIKDKLVSQGMIADLVIHDPPVRNDRHQPIDSEGNPTNDPNKMIFRNPHAHILVTVRPMDAYGKWQRKTEIEYVCKRGTEECRLTPSEFPKAKNEGWEKQYRYYDGHNKVWLTAEEGKRRDLKRVSRMPKTSPYGRKNETAAYWNDKARIYEWREYWEHVVNQKFEAMHSNIRIDHRSYIDQGREDELPTMHLGPSAWNMQKRADRKSKEGKAISDTVHSEIGEINREIHAYNLYIRNFRNTLSSINKVSDQESMSAVFQSLRSKLIFNQYQRNLLTRNLKALQAKLEYQKQVLDQIDRLQQSYQTTIHIIEELKGKQQGLHAFQIRANKELSEEIHTMEKKAENIHTYLDALMEREDLRSEQDLTDVRQEYEQSEQQYRDFASELTSLSQDHDRYLADYRSLAEKYLEDTPQFPDDGMGLPSDEISIPDTDLEPNLLATAVSVTNKKLDQITTLYSKVQHQTEQESKKRTHR
ncbi:MAG: MobA/MobL family protein [Lachnospiraceae bacterium]|nr:MobA/MobL family protein [Lachnospiraceae bacterium]